MVLKMPVHGVAAETKQGARRIQLQSSERPETMFKVEGKAEVRVALHRLLAADLLPLGRGGYLERGAEA